MLDLAHPFGQYMYRFLRGPRDTTAHVMLTWLEQQSKAMLEGKQSHGGSVRGGADMRPLAS